MRGDWLPLLLPNLPPCLCPSTLPPSIIPFLILCTSSLLPFIIPTPLLFHLSPTLSSSFFSLFLFLTQALHVSQLTLCSSSSKTVTSYLYLGSLSSVSFLFLPIPLPHLPAFSSSSPPPLVPSFILVPLPSSLSSFIPSQNFLV